MKWNELTDPARPFVLTLVDTGDPLPLLVTGQTAGHLYAWTGNDDHLLRLKGAEFEAGKGEQGRLIGPQGEILGYVARADDTAEIADLPTFLSTMERLRAQIDQQSFQDWLKAEIEITD